MAKKTFSENASSSPSTRTRAHKKFDDEEFHTADEGSDSIEEIGEDQVVEESDEEDSDDSDDDAPEEESVSTGKAQYEAKTTQESNLAKEESKRNKEKRIAQQERFAEQQNLRKLKLAQLAEQDLIRQQKEAKLAKEREIKQSNKQIEEELIQQELLKQLSKHTKLSQLKTIQKEKQGARKIKGTGIQVRALSDAQKARSKVVKSGINKDSLLNKRKKKLNKRI